MCSKPLKDGSKFRAHLAAKQRVNFNQTQIQTSKSMNRNLKRFGDINSNSLPAMFFLFSNLPKNSVKTIDTMYHNVSKRVLTGPVSFG